MPGRSSRRTGGELICQIVKRELSVAHTTAQPIRWRTTTGVTDAMPGVMDLGSEGLWDTVGEQRHQLIQRRSCGRVLPRRRPCRRCHRPEHMITLRMLAVHRRMVHDEECGREGTGQTSICW